MKNRILSLLLVLVMVICMTGVLASCGKDKGKDKNQGGGGGNGDDTGSSANYPWDTTDIFFQMSDNSNGKELSSGARRYLAGTSNDNETIDVEIDKRNGKAAKECKVRVIYDYWPDDDGYKWGQNIDRIYSLVQTSSTSAPDMYSVFVYDMVGALLRGCFTNIKGDSHGDNYFRFLESDYDYFNPKNVPADADDEGFMYEYMTSLTLSSKKMYLVASDYFTDLVRAFFVVPVNIKLLQENAVSVTGDADGDGEAGTYADLIYIVRENGWNYELLKAYCDTVKMENADGVVDLEGIVGFAISGASGLSSSGLLYTTPITIINRHGSDITDYEYSYPNTNTQLTDFCVELEKLMSSEGAYVYSGDGANGSLDTIRKAFANNHVLFGGVICVGSLEDEVYQRMRQDGGFGVVPVPLYAETYTKTDSFGNVTTEKTQYLTQIHNIGRIGGISSSSMEFSQCTAFLNYVSTHSTDILNEYYDWKLSVGVVGGTGAGDANAEMLALIRQNVRSAFDKVFEDALGIYGSFGNDLYHKIIQNGGAGATELSSIRTDPYKIGENMATLYAGLVSTRQKALEGLVDAFEDGNFGE